MDWLAALADANNARTGGGEMGALRSVGLGAPAGRPHLDCVPVLLQQIFRAYLRGRMQLLASQHKRCQRGDNVASIFFIGPPPSTQLCTRPLRLLVHQARPTASAST
jgi:hypothetical protein